MKTTEPSPSQPPRGFGRRLGAALLAIVAVVGTLGFLYLKRVDAVAREDVRNNLEVVAELKVQQIVRWREQLRSDANVLMESPFLAEAVARCLANPQAANNEPLLIRFRSLQTHHHYHDVLLVDASGQVRLSLSGHRGPLHEEAAPALAAALSDRRVMFTDLHAGPGDLPPHLDVIVPFSATNAAATELRSAIILQVAARDFLYPLIQTWPTPSPSAETLLIRREGDDVVFLNELRHRKGTALSLRFPISKEDLPAARAARGETGMAEGADYRGVPVLACVRAVPGTKWFMVAKVDQQEVYAALRQQTLMAIIIVSLLIVAICLGVGLLWRQQRVRFYKERAEGADALRQSEKRFMDVLYAARDAILLIEGEKFMDCNEAAAQMLGYASREAFLMSYPSQLSPPLQSDGRKSFEKANEMMQTAIENGSHRFEWVHRRANGEDFPVEVSLTAISLGGKTMLHCLWHDITKRKRAAAENQQQLDELRRWQAVMLGREDHNMKLKREVNELSRRLGEPVRYPSQESGQGTVDSGQ